LGEDAKVLTVLGAGKGQPLDLDDLGLKKGFGFLKTLTVMPTYNDLMIEVTPLNTCIFVRYSDDLEIS
jgi:hypothetical protein